MADLNNLSRIGIGCYRMASNCQQHYDALVRALSLGCNLIDTSANYLNGESEKLIGMAIRNNPEYDPFVMTKAGYIQDSNLEIVAKLNKAGRAENDLVAVSDDFKYSIHPDFLENQIGLSCGRLQKKRINGFLLHNPEHYFDQPINQTSTGEYYRRIKKAFEFLEEKVEQGHIQYYGISSNTFPFNTDIRNTTNLHKVLAIAREVSQTNHFRLIQFPFNLVETDALKGHHGDVGLLELARANKIVTFSNRPLNAKTDDGMLRLAAYQDEVGQLDEENDKQLLLDCLGLINRQLSALEVDDDAMDFVVISLLKDNWMRLSNPDAVNEIFQGHFYPFIKHLYEDNVPEADMSVFIKFHQLAYLYSKRTMTLEASAFRKKLIEDEVIRRDDERTLPVIACENYLRSGIDHVLIGMRSIKYVESMRALF